MSHRGWFQKSRLGFQTFFSKQVYLGVRWTKKQQQQATSYPQLHDPTNYQGETSKESCGSCLVFVKEEISMLSSDACCQRCSDSGGSGHVWDFWNSVVDRGTIDPGVLGSWLFSHKTRCWFQICFIFIPYLGKWSNLTSIFFQMGWFNHQLEKIKHAQKITEKFLDFKNVACIFETRNGWVEVRTPPIQKCGWNSVG